jgi:hypothetical protein
MSLSEDEINQWQQIILANEVDADRSLKRLGEENHEQFMALCHKLLKKSSPEVRRVVLRRLGFQGNHNDAFAEAIALAALEEPREREAALIALRRIATPAAFPALLRYAGSGYFLALKAAAWQAQTEEQRHQVLALARRQVLSETPHMREIAVRVIRTFSSPAAEEALLLEAAQRYFDEFVFGALRQATLQALPTLLGMQAKMRPRTAEYNDASRAIEALQKRAQTS